MNGVAKIKGNAGGQEEGISYSPWYVGLPLTVRENPFIILSVQFKSNWLSPIPNSGYLFKAMESSIDRLPAEAMTFPGRFVSQKSL